VFLSKGSKKTPHSFVLEKFHVKNFSKQLRAKDFVSFLAVSLHGKFKSNAKNSKKQPKCL
jgi:hypothetical protein